MFWVIRGVQAVLCRILKLQNTQQYDLARLALHLILGHPKVLLKYSPTYSGNFGNFLESDSKGFMWVKVRFN